MPPRFASLGAAGNYGWKVFKKIAGVYEVEAGATLDTDKNFTSSKNIYSKELINKMTAAGVVVGGVAAAAMAAIVINKRR